MALKSRFGPLVSFVICSAIVVLEWFLRTRAGVIHPIMLLIAGGGITLGLLGLVSPEATQLTADNKLKPLANKVAMAGLGVGALAWLALR